MVGPHRYACVQAESAHVAGPACLRRVTGGQCLQRQYLAPGLRGTAANSAKYLSGEACFDACQQAVMTHGGYGYAKEYHVERYLRESLIGRIAPVSPQLILCYIAERVLGLPKSY